MSFLLGKKLGGHKHRTPEELVKITKEQLQALSDLSDAQREKILERLSRYLAELKIYLIGDGEEQPVKEIVKIVAVEACRAGLPMLMGAKLPQLDFEARKDAAAVFCQILRVQQTDGSFMVVDYIKGHQQVLSTIMNGYEDSNVSLIAGGMLRDCIRHEDLAALVLNSPLFDNLYTYVELENFEVASDAFHTLKDLLTRHKKLVSDHLTAHYEEFFAK